MKRFDYLDVLKGIAIIAVVLYHIGYMQFGFLGVDIFLVVNGFLLAKAFKNQRPDPCPRETIFEFTNY